MSEGRRCASAFERGELSVCLVGDRWAVASLGRAAVFVVLVAINIQMTA